MPKILLDAQLPRRLKVIFTELGFEVLHTLDLPLQNRTPDTELVRLSLEEDYIIMSKDNDFVESYLLSGKPRKLLLLSCGNINNKELELLLRANMQYIKEAFEQNTFIELSSKDIVIHS